MTARGALRSRIEEIHRLVGSADGRQFILMLAGVLALASADSAMVGAHG